jgi:hypothetical protein
VLPNFYRTVIRPLRNAPIIEVRQPGVLLLSPSPTYHPRTPGFPRYGHKEAGALQGTRPLLLGFHFGDVATPIMDQPLREESKAGRTKAS